MDFKNYLNADDVAKSLSISKPFAYRIIHMLNDELKDKGYITIAGRINTKYFSERVYEFKMVDEK